MPRLLFQKTGNAVWISHLDLMRLFQRAFKRAGLPLTHTHGFNPRPSVSIALPLSVGVESNCELLDFDLDGESVPNQEICEKLNRVLVPGVRVLQVYEDARRIKDLTLMNSVVTLEYDNGLPENAVDGIERLFASSELIVPKKGKNGMADQDIIPLIRELKITKNGDKELLMDCVVCCQNPTLNPMQLAAAINIYLPEYRPDFVKCKRIEIFDDNMMIFR